MTQPIYEKGTIKVVWIKDDSGRIYSKMFNQVEKARKFAEPKKDYIIFALVKQKNMEDFEWKILPLGKYRLYQLAVRLYRKYGNKLIKLLKL
ncbi:hypothetical protein A3C98_04030 [Candidatus Roizmanbacteria bacterium RIFCSPHIGHO2_02_FULL_37_15]|uniref:Uncharacterized protein n=1 Tax=Candidatus Roizmanbacteria bacterium RIFCSPLOWO2_01_FULL_37_16 TaxID=1802058 RepID=A0A1F7IMQ1_9BACT|nr:MAG: hypothetical protein A2859_04230 [Candidatus Roizmanbacteria bacterium RIFCSPHIGHO2_01_FULL_37_16b]OGK22492.1 MAG: hypothetical protein A3C98_04030 [Candidatus Roizmanbacteria bacterium RIFCSPHIGHO2_02_FULL_37_15]OGK33550.1 MAG: hypothetical protein A3F57_05605 [Candidatus Roizmanbacteria bacterium RIFCSPHIGHO2_12_FULL_36_11]OGK44580.1 MAG: hypothetical protein A3B40_05350 [Candidatus Roizmanbacteria bacterium RIFCSPLOWO2_01_FULL_37_16]OGK56858.1 MAG: hypothetical protein A3I50_03230 [C